MMLKNSESLTEFAKEHRTLFEKICDAVFEFIEKIRGAINSLYGNETAKNPEAQFMELYAEDLQKIFDKALSDALNASEATVDHNLPKNEKTAGEGGRVQYERAGNLSDGTEVYETGNNISGKTFTEKIEIFKKNFYSENSPHYLGQKIAFEDDTEKVHWAEIDRHTQNENINKINPGHLNQWDKAKINIGAEGDFVTLLQSSKYNGEKENKNRTKNDAHKLTKYFEYYLKTVVIDKKAFDVVINIRREDSGKRYVYEVKLNKTKESSQLAPQIAKFYNDRRTKVENSTRLSELSSGDRITQSKSHVNGKVQKSAAEAPAYATMPEFYTPLEGEYGYLGEGYTAENGLKLFTKYSVDTARDFIMSELMLTEGKTELARDLNEFYTFMATAEKLTWEDIEKRASEIADRHLSKRSERVRRDPRAQEALDTLIFLLF